MKKLLSLILIFILFSCNSQPSKSNSIYDFELDLNLSQDANWYFHLVHWMSNTFYEMNYFGFTELVPIINGSSYTYEDGVAHTMFGPHLEQIGDTVSVLVGYTDSHTFECYALDVEIILD